MTRLLFILIFSLQVVEAHTQDDMIIKDYDWLIALTDSIDENTTYCDECQIPPYLRSYLTPRGVQRFALIYRCDGLTKTSTVHYDIDGSIAAACIADSTEMDCPFSFVYEEFSLGMSVTTIWECTKGFDCTSTPRSVLFPPYDIVVQNDLCKSDVTTLSVSEEYTSYVWTSPQGTISQNPTITDSISGDYQLIISDENGCMDTTYTTIDTQEPIELKIQGERVICSDECVELSVSEYAKYLWSTGDDAQSIVVKDQGFISLIVENEQGCSDMAEVEIIDGRNQTISINTSVTEIYEGQTITISLEVNDMSPNELSDISWSIDGKQFSDETSLDITISGVIPIEVSAINKSGCLVSDQIDIEPLPVFRNLYLPNVISPNQSEANSTFYIQGVKGTVKLSNLSIYNRWGTLMFFNSNPIINDISSGWNGRTNGTTAAMGVYVYQVTVEYADHTTEQITGSITLVL